MKTIYTLSTIVLIALSLNSLADDKITNKEKSAAVSVAPFIWGDPDATAPVELAGLRVKNAFVPVAPFVWGSPDDVVMINENKNVLVPVAPFVYGNPDSDVPAELAHIKAININVPVAPFIFGDPDLDVPVDLVALN